MKKSELDVWSGSLPPGGREWLAYAARGASSETMFSVLTGFPVLRESEYHYPMDASDFCRCRILLAMVPDLRPRLEEMRVVGRKWAVLVDHWDELCALMDSESRWFQGDRTGRAPATNKRMDELFRLCGEADDDESLARYKISEPAVRNDDRD